jgi:serine/threonine protein kinase
VAGGPGGSADEKIDGASAETVTAAPGSARPGPQGAGLPRGTAVGRYVILRQLGGGAIGVVYAAYDPELDRKLAIKILRTEASGKLEGSEARGRMQREAQAMARLTHTNVIAVYDAGTFEDQVFVAMEFVDGQTLRGWLKEKPRSWREVRDVFLLAGRGLAAAHAAGLVHRDFKPENVLIGVGGRVCVGDFGLARSATAAEPSAPVALEDTALGSGSDALSATLTRTGAFLGTPAYMAPEQLMGRKADTRADQFSFCIALYEALYGQRPFAGDTIGDLSFAIMKGRIREPPAGCKVPAWLRAVVQRGLAADPEQRFDSIDAMLHALGRDPALRWRRALTVLSTALVVAGLAFWLGHRRTLPAPRVLPKPMNLDLEEGVLGSVPNDWVVPAAISAYEVTLTDEQPFSGRRCGKIRSSGQRGPDDRFGNLMQVLDARPWRGKRVRLRAMVRTAEGSMAQMWMRVDRPRNVMGFFDNMGERPISTATWREVEIVGDIDNDAELLNFGLMLIGDGVTWLDHVTVEAVGDDVSVTGQYGKPVVPMPAAENLDFEQAGGLIPAHWRLEKMRDQELQVRVTRDQPHGGTQAVELLREGKSPEVDFTGGVSQTVDATRWRGKHIRLRAWMRTGGDAQARILLMVGRGGYKIAFSADLSDAPVHSPVWTQSEIIAPVAPSATEISYSLTMDGTGTVWFDDVSLEEAK